MDRHETPSSDKNDNTPTQWDELSSVDFQPNTEPPTDMITPDQTTDMIPPTDRKETKTKTVSEKNYQKLKKYYGDSFVRRPNEENPGLTSRALSAFAEFPDFADRLKTLIPNKHDALIAFQDNFDYINATLQNAYEPKKSTEKEVPKDPYELAKRVGYELTGPFEDIKDFEEYKEDFRKKERICTYKDPKARLEAYHILWLRHQNVDNILPANKLSKDSLSDEWKQHLREIGRYDKESDTYNIKDIKPSREDPYGTSSMSVQISRSGTHVSIKNRYNHTVDFPDSTLSNNLDKLTDGLRLAVYHRVGRDDLMEPGNMKIDSSKYVKDNSGGIHRCFFESGNVYYGRYEKIEDGNVTTLPENEYHMLSPDLYIKKSGEKVVALNELNVNYARVTTEQTAQGFEVNCYDEKDKLALTYTFDVDEKTQKMRELNVNIAEGAIIRGTDFNKEALVTLNISKGAKVNTLSDILCSNNALTTLSIAENAEVGSIIENNALTTLSIAEGAKAYNITENDVLTTLSIAKKAEVWSAARNNNLSTINVAKGSKIRRRDIYRNHPNIIVNREGSLGGRIKSLFNRKKERKDLING